MASFDYSEEELLRILQSYKSKRERERLSYIKKKDNPEFKEINRERARQHYVLNKHLKREKYTQDRELIKAKSSYYYYKKRLKLDVFESKYPDRYSLLDDVGFI